MPTQLHLTKGLNLGQAHADVDRLAYYLDAAGYLDPGVRNDAQALSPILSDARRSAPPITCPGGVSGQIVRSGVLWEPKRWGIVPGTMPA